MTLNLLDHFILSQLFTFLLIFARVGAAIMMMPGIGDAYVSARVRLLLALAFAVLLTPILIDQFPPIPASIYTLGIWIIVETLIGVFIGMIGRTILSMLHVAGTIIAYQSSLAVSSIFDPVTGAQTAVISNFMTIMAITVMFALNLHHLMFASVVDSYTVFRPGHYPIYEDMFKYDVRLVADCFAMGVLLAAPHIIFSFVFYLMGGLMGRLMPNFQVIAVLLPPQILIAFLIMFAIIPVVAQVFADFMQDHLATFVSSGSL